MELLKGKVALITGAARGIGKQIALKFAEEGADIAFTDLVIDETGLQTKEELEAFGVRVLAIASNAADFEQTHKTVEQVVETFGRVDILVNCAGAAKNAGVIDMTDDEWDFTIATDETSVFKMTRAFAAIMKERGYGRIINIASMYGLVGNTKIPTIAYHASKGAVVNFTRATAAELAPYGITCNCICPGYFETELTKETLDTDDFQNFAKTMVPMGRYGQEGELNPAIIFLASEEASYVTGAILPVDGGYTAI